MSVSSKVMMINTDEVKTNTGVQGVGAKKVGD